MNKVKITRKILKPWARIFIIIVLVFFAIISFLLILNGKNPSKEKIPNYNYKINKKIDYKVHILQNDFYDEEFLDENLHYPSELIDYISIDFSYLLNGSKVSNYIYTYDVIATIIGEYENTSNGKSELWKKKYNLLEKQDRVKNNSTNFDIKQNIKINYKEYDDIVNKYKSEFNIAIDAYLNVKIKIDYIGNIVDDNSSISDVDYMEVNIPLNKPIVKINTNNDKDENKKVEKTQIVFKDYKMIRIGYIILAIDLLAFALLLPSLFLSSKSLYIKDLRRIMKSYSEIIVEIESLPNLENLELLDIKEFDDMIDIEEETKSPILYYEVKENLESWFLIIINNYIYRYVLKK